MPPPFEVGSPTTQIAFGESTAVAGLGSLSLRPLGPPFDPPRGRTAELPPVGVPPGPPFAVPPGPPFEVPSGRGYSGRGHGPVGSQVPEPAPALLVFAGLLLGAARLRRR